MTCRIPALSLVGLFLLAVPAFIARPTPALAFVFSDITSEAVADTGFIRDKKGVALVDFDGDGDLDISVVGEGTRHVTLVRNDGGTFVQITSGDLLRPGSGSGQTWADFDEDGDLDLFVTLEEEPSRLYRNDGGGVFTDITSGPLLEVIHGHSTAWVDYDRDGDLDLYYASLNTPSRLVRNDGGTWSDATHDSLGVLYGDGVAWSDFDGDGDLDVYLARFSSRPNRMLINLGGVFVNESPPPLANAGNGHSCAAADYDNDGDMDLFLCNANNPNVLFRNLGDGTFVNVTTSALALSLHSIGVCWGDYDNDGDLDLYVTVSDGESSHMFRNDGGTFVDVTSGPLDGTGSAAGVANGDVDGDGDLDLYISSYFRQPNKLLRNDLPPGNHWLEVDLVGTVSPRTAIGARVVVETDGLTQTREIQACTGYRSQSQLAAHFGLGTATQVNTVRVRWPSGVQSETTLVAVDQRITLVEPDDLPLAVFEQDRSFALRARPNPSAGTTHIDYALPVDGPAAVRVLDVQGRTVRWLVQADDARAGRHGIVWDGRDASGVAAPEGVYFIAVSSRRGSAVRRVIVLR